MNGLASQNFLFQSGLLHPYLRHKLIEGSLISGYNLAS
jgi:hypothetical protein